MVVVFLHQDGMHIINSLSCLIKFFFVLAYVFYFDHYQVIERITRTIFWPLNIMDSRFQGKGIGKLLCPFGGEVAGGQCISKLGSVIELQQFNCMGNSLKSILPSLHFYSR